MATSPGQVWSWDITRLLGPRKWSYFYLKYTTMIANIVPCSAVMFRKACYYNVIRRIMAVFTDSLLSDSYGVVPWYIRRYVIHKVGHNTCVNDRLRLSSWHG